MVWEDEADIDLNPRIGSDWRLPGTQRTVLTSGKNVKRYFAACMDTQTGRLTWVKCKRKNSDLFIAMLQKLLRNYAERKVSHVILDNFGIHSSRQTQAWLQRRGRESGCTLPPYCPDDNGRLFRSAMDG